MNNLERERQQLLARLEALEAENRRMRQLLTAQATLSPVEVSTVLSNGEAEEEEEEEENVTTATATTNAASPLPSPHIFSPSHSPRSVAAVDVPAVSPSTVFFSDYCRSIAGASVTLAASHPSLHDSPLTSCIATERGQTQLFFLVDWRLRMAGDEAMNCLNGCSSRRRASGRVLMQRVSARRRRRRVSGMEAGQLLWRLYSRFNK